MRVVRVLRVALHEYHYIKKRDEAAAYYEINEYQAIVAQEFYRLYAEEFLSIGAITRELNARRIPNKKAISKWERSTVWAMLRNPALQKELVARYDGVQ